MPQQVKHVIEHTIRPPPDLPPIQQPNQPPRVTYQPPPPVIVAPPPPPPQIMQQQQPQIIQAPPAPHIIAANPSPVITNLNPTSDNRSMFNKAGKDHCSSFATALLWIPHMLQLKLFCYEILTEIESSISRFRHNPFSMHLKWIVLFAFFFSFKVHRSTQAV